MQEAAWRPNVMYLCWNDQDIRPQGGLLQSIPYLIN